MFQSISEYYISRVLFTIGVLIVTLVVTFAVKKILDILFHGVKNRRLSSHIVSKTRTLRALLKNIIDVIFLAISILIILSHWGVDIRPVLAGAGIVGLAISFGSQTLVRDLLAGFFIILEDQYNIGDRIKINDFEGTVERITLRLTVLRDKDGNYIYLPNSTITNVRRFSSP